MLTTLLPITMLVRLPQELNALFPMFVTLFGSITLVNLEHDWNVELPTLGTLIPIVMLVRLLQELNALLPRLMTLSGITTLGSLVQDLKAEGPMLVRLLLVVKFVRLMQELNALLPMLRMLFGSVTDVTVDLFRKTLLLMLVTEKPLVVLGITTLPPEPV